MYVISTVKNKITFKLITNSSFISAIDFIFVKSYHILRVDCNKSKSVTY